MAITDLILTNQGTSTTTGAINNTDDPVTFSVASGDGNLKFPTLTGSKYHKIVVANPDGTYEIMKVTSRTGDSLTATRAQEGTTKIAFSSGAIVSARFTAGDLDDILSRIGWTTFAGTLLDDTTAAEAQATIGVAWVPVKKFDLTGLASQSIYHGSGGVVFDGTYLAYKFVFDNVAINTEATGNYLYARAILSGPTIPGSSYTQAAIYDGQSSVGNDFSSSATGITTLMALTPTSVTLGCGTSEAISGEALITGPSVTQRHALQWDLMFPNTSGLPIMARGKGMYGSNSAWIGVQFGCGVNGIEFDSGTISLYGLRAPS